MPYIKRGPDGRICAMFAESQQQTDEEFLAPNHPDVADFMLTAPGDAADQNFPLAADLRMIRVIEDLIDLLIAKDVFVFTDLPLAVQQKILAQKSHREKLFGGNSSLVVDDDTPLF